MDAMSNLSKTLDSSANKEFLNTLINDFKHFLREKEEISNKAKELEKENCELKNHLIDLQNKKDAINYEKRKWKKNFDNIKQKQILDPSNSEKFFTETCELLGYRLEKDGWDKEHRAEYVKFSFNDECFVRIIVYSAEQKELVEIMPPHPNFENIREFFHQTQDSAGLLCTLLKYFKALKK